MCDVGGEYSHTEVVTSHPDSPRRRFETTYFPIVLAERWLDMHGEMVKLRAWLRGLFLVGGFAGAHKAAAGLA